MTMKIAGIRELKARLSAYIHHVQAGEVVLVTDRGRIVAEMCPPGSVAKAGDVHALRYRALVESGAIRPASTPEDRAWIKGSFHLKRGVAAALLDAERSE